MAAQTSSGSPCLSLPRLRRLPPCASNICLPRRYGFPAVSLCPLTTFTLSSDQRRGLQLEYLRACRFRVGSSSVDGEKSGSSEPVFSWKKLALFTGCAGGLYAAAQTSAAAGLQAKVMASWLGQSGFVAALSLIFLSEIGDKTFFIAALLAMRLGKWVTFLGASVALALTSILSVCVGVMFNAVPDAMRQSAPWGEYLGSALLVLFGVRNIWSAWTSKPKTSGNLDDDSEMADAKETLRKAEESGKVVTKNAFQSFIEVASLIFVGEWGDRSMFTTIALGASQDPLGVVIGATAAHMLATALAVIGGALAGNFISERSVNFVSGGLFLIFAIATIMGFM